MAEQNDLLEILGVLNTINALPGFDNIKGKILFPSSPILPSTNLRDYANSFGLSVGYDVIPMSGVAQISPASNRGVDHHQYDLVCKNFDFFRHLLSHFREHDQLPPHSMTVTYTAREHSVLCAAYKPELTFTAESVTHLEEGRIGGYLYRPSKNLEEIFG